MSATREAALREELVRARLSGDPAHVAAVLAELGIDPAEQPDPKRRAPRARATAATAPERAVAE